MKATDIVNALVVDTIDTTGRIRNDVAHLRELGRRAKTGAKLAVQATRSRLERMLEDVADGIADADERWSRTHAPHGRSRR